MTRIPREVPTHRRVLAATTALATATVLAACGIPTDDLPRAISPSSITSTTNTTAFPDDPDATKLVEQIVYLVEGSATGSPDGERLAEYAVDVPSTTDETQLVRSTLEALIALSSDKGLTNAVPSGTQILAIELNDAGTVLTVDLSEEFNDVEQSLQRSAFAQLVFSATSVKPTSIERVRFRVDGDWIAPATGNDQSPPAAGDAVTRDDYPVFASAIASSTTEVGTG